MVLDDEAMDQVRALFEAQRDGVIADVRAVVEKAIGPVLAAAARPPAPVPAPSGGASADMVATLLLRMVESAEKRAERLEAALSETRKGSGLGELGETVSVLRALGVSLGGSSVGAVVAEKLIDKADPLLEGLGAVLVGYGEKMAAEGEARKTGALPASTDPAKG